MRWNVAFLEERNNQCGYCSKKCPGSPMSEVQIPSPAEQLGGKHGAFGIPPSVLHLFQGGTAEVVGHSQRFTLGLEVGAGFVLDCSFGRHYECPFYDSGVVCFVSRGVSFFSLVSSPTSTDYLLFYSAFF